MSSYISAALRCLVAVRADALCEYCLIHEDDAVFGCEFDHIISEKHGGATDAENLAYACAFCNRAKGSDIGSIVPRTGYFVRFFNPRIDRWAEHFTLYFTPTRVCLYDGCMSLSRMWQHQGKRAEAYDLLAPVYNGVTEGFDTADLQEAKALLEELGT